MKMVQFLLVASLLGAVGAAHATEVTPASAHGNTTNSALYGSAQYHAIQAVTPATQDEMSTVPEPEGWTMMLIGLGLVVFQIRRRAKSSKAWNLRQGTDSK